MNKLIFLIFISLITKQCQAQAFAKSAFNVSTYTGFINSDYIGSNQGYIVDLQLNFTRFIGLSAEYERFFTERFGARARIGLKHYNTKFNYDYTTIGPMPPVGEVYEQAHMKLLNLNWQMQVLFAAHKRVNVYALVGMEYVLQAEAILRSNYSNQETFYLTEEDVNNAFIVGLGFEYLMIYSKKHRFSVFLDGLVRTQPLCNDCIPLTEANDNPQPFGLHLGLRYQFVMD